MMEAHAVYSTELTDEERELGFEVFELPGHAQHGSHQCKVTHTVAYRFSETDRIAKLNVPVIGGHSYRHERLEQPAESNTPLAWVPVNSIVFPTAQQAVGCLGGPAGQLQYCNSRY